MAIQVNLDIPPKIRAGIDSGDLIRIGSVVRDRISGSIVKHLSEAPGPAKIQRTAGRAAANLMRPRGIAVAALSVAAVGAVGATVLVAAQQRKRASDSELPESVEKYSASLRAYVEAARKGALDAGTVSQLISDLDAVHVSLSSPRRSGGGLPSPAPNSLCPHFIQQPGPYGANPG